MPHFSTLTSPAVPLFQDRLDTEFIAPPGVGGSEAAFAALRRDSAGRLLWESLFSRAPFAQAAIIIVGAEFGVGPRPEPAAAALAKSGFACILGVSFAPAFAECAFDAGLLTLTLERPAAAALAEEALNGDALTIDLDAATAVNSHGWRVAFDTPNVIRARFAASRLSKYGAAERGEADARADDRAGHVIYAGRA